MVEIKRVIERRKWHQDMMELIRRSLENDSLDAPKAQTSKERDACPSVFSGALGI